MFPVVAHLVMFTLAPFVKKKTMRTALSVAALHFHWSSCSLELIQALILTLNTCCCNIVLVFLGKKKKKKSQEAFKVKLYHC